MNLLSSMFLLYAPPFRAYFKCANAKEMGCPANSGTSTLRRHRPACHSSFLGGTTTSPTLAHRLKQQGGGDGPGQTEKGKGGGQRRLLSKGATAKGLLGELQLFAQSGAHTIIPGLAPPFQP